MDTSKMKAGKAVSQQSLEKFRHDLKLLLEVFTVAKLAKWLGTDKGQLSKKFNGHEPITLYDLNRFHKHLDIVLDKLKRGIEPYQIELEMCEALDADNEHPSLYEQVRELKEAVRELKLSVEELKGGGPIVFARQLKQYRLAMVDMLN